MGMHQDFSLLLKDVLDEINQQLTDRRAGVEGVGAVAELKEMYQELSNLADRLKYNALPPLDQRRLWAAHIVTDTWPPREKLGERICLVDFIYRYSLE